MRLKYKLRIYYFVIFFIFFYICICTEKSLAQSQTNKRAERLKYLNDSKIYFAANDEIDYSIIFKKYPKTGSYTGKIAQINFSSDPKSKRFRARLSQGIKEGPNYSGKYRVIDWGCGTNCTQIVVVNVESGVICSWVNTCGASLYKLDSKLLIINPGATEIRKSYPDGCETEFYIIESH